MLRARYSQSPNHIGVSLIQTELPDLGAARRIPETLPDPGAARRVPEARLSWEDPAIAQVKILPSLTTGTEKRVTFDQLAETHPVRSAHHQLPTAMEWSRDRNSASGSSGRPRSMEGSITPRAEREVSDLYIDSITRTPRYGLGRHKTYDEMLMTMSIEDPFNTDYSPSGKQPGGKANVTLPAKKRRDTSVLKDDFSNTYPLKSENSPDKSKVGKEEERPLTGSSRDNTLKVTQTTLVSDADMNTAKSIDLFHGDGKRRTLSLSSADDSPRQRKFSVSSDDFPRQKKLSKLSGESPRTPFLWTDHGSSKYDNSPRGSIEDVTPSGIQPASHKSNYAISMDSVNKYEEHLENSWRIQPLSRSDRELTDSYIDNVTRTPRYGLGRHKTYDEILLTMSRDDPFLNSYTPSGKKPIKHKTTVAKHSNKIIFNKREEDTLSESCPALNEKGPTKMRKTNKKEEVEIRDDTQKSLTKSQDDERIKDDSKDTVADSKDTKEQMPEQEARTNQDLKENSEAQNQHQKPASHDDRLIKSNGRISPQRDQSQTEMLTRKPRYGLGRHNTYDDMLATMSLDDPFKGDYSPSGKPRTENKSTPKVRRNNSVNEKQKSFEIKNNTSNVNSKTQDHEPKMDTKGPLFKKVAAATAENKSKVVEVEKQTAKSNDTHKPGDSEKTEKASGIKKDGVSSNQRAGLRKTTLSDKKKDIAQGLQHERSNLSLPTNEKPTAKNEVSRHKTFDDILLVKRNEQDAVSQAKSKNRRNEEENIKAHLTLLKSKRRDAFGNALKLSENDELNLTNINADKTETIDKKSAENSSTRPSFVNKNAQEKKYIVRTNSKLQVNDKNITSHAEPNKNVPEAKDSHRKPRVHTDTDEKKAKGFAQDKKAVSNASVEKKMNIQETQDKKPLAATVQGKQNNSGNEQEKKSVVGGSFKRAVSNNSATEKKVSNITENENKTNNKAAAEKFEAIPSAKDKSKNNVLKKEKSSASESSLKSKSKTEIEKNVSSPSIRDKKQTDNKLNEKKEPKIPEEEVKVIAKVTAKVNNSNDAKLSKNAKSDALKQLKSSQTSKNLSETEKSAAGNSIPDKKVFRNTKVKPKGHKTTDQDNKIVSTADVKSKSPEKRSPVKSNTGNTGNSSKSNKSDNIALTKENILKDLNKKVGTGPKDSDSGSVKSDATYTVNDDQKKLSDSRSGKLKRPVVK